MAIEKVTVENGLICKAPRVWPYSAPRAVHVCRTVPGTKPRRRLGLSVCASVESAIAEIARLGYEAVAFSDSRLASEGLGLFICDTVACLDRTG